MIDICHRVVNKALGILKHHGGVHAPRSLQILTVYLSKRQFSDTEDNLPTVIYFLWKRCVSFRYIMSQQVSGCGVNDVLKPSSWVTN